MEKLEDIGIALTNAPAKFERVRDLEVFEGPLITEFRANDRDAFLFVWRDKDSKHNRWLAIPVQPRDIALFEQRVKTLHALITNAPFWYLADVDGKGRFRRWYVTALEQLPPRYIPADDSFFDPDLRPARSRKERAQRVLIEGQWGLSEIIEYPRRYLDVYSTQYCLAPGSQQRVPDRAFKWNFGSGYVYHNFFQNLGRSVPKADRAQVQALQYSSPGIMQFSLNEEVAGQVLETVRRVQAQMEETKVAYDEIHLWLKAKKGKKVAKKKEHLVMSDRAVHGELRKFCEMLGAIDYDRLRGLTSDSVNAAEIVLSFYRRLRVLASYELDRRAVIVSVDNPLDPTLLHEPQAPSVLVAGDEDADSDDYDADDDDAAE